VLPEDRIVPELGLVDEEFLIVLLGLVVLEFLIVELLDLIRVFLPSVEFIELDSLRVE